MLPSQQLLQQILLLTFQYYLLYTAIGKDSVVAAFFAAHYDDTASIAACAAVGTDVVARVAVGTDVAAYAAAGTDVATDGAVGIDVATDGINAKNSVATRVKLR